MTNGIKAKLIDLHYQATHERSHYYVGSMCRDALVEIEFLETQLAEARAALVEVDDIIENNSHSLSGFSDHYDQQAALAHQSTKVTP